MPPVLHRQPEVTADGGTTPKQQTGWMWDLTIPGNNDHDFYVLAGSLNQSGDSHRTYHVVAGDTPVLVHNSNCPTARFVVDSNGVVTDRNPPSRGLTDRTTLGGANEAEAMELVQEYPQYGNRLPLTMGDPRWPADDGGLRWSKRLTE